MRRTFFTICLLVSSLLAASLLPAFARASEPVTGDYDGDSRADLAEARVNLLNQTTQWSIRHANGATTTHNFAAAADGFILGRFVQDKRATPGIVSAHSNRPLEWRIKTPEGGEVFLHYGFENDILPNLGDLDCDGITDLTVVRNNGRSDLPGLKVWYTALSASATIVETVFGNIFDRVGVADIDGDDCDEMIVLREGFHWFSRKASGGNTTVVQWGLPGDIPLMPFDVNNDGSTDYVIVRSGPGGQLAYVRLGAQSVEVHALGPERTTPLGGRFDDNTPFAYVSREFGLAQFAGHVGNFSFANPASALIGPNGDVFDSDEDGKFFRAGDTGVMTANRAFDDQVGYGCGAPRVPDGKNKKRAWIAAAESGLPRYWLLGKARLLEIFSANGKLIDRFNLLKPGAKNKRELWESNFNAPGLALYAPLLLKETGTNGKCEWIIINNPHVNWD